MAITTLPPEVLIPAKAVTSAPQTRKRPVALSKGSKVFLRLLPDLKVEEGGRLSSRGFIIIMAGVVALNVLVLLGINTLMAQDAFVLERLKISTNHIKDQRDALVKLAESKSSPDVIAASATKLGMVPGSEIHYLTLTNAK